MWSTTAKNTMEPFRAQISTSLYTLEVKICPFMKLCKFCLQQRCFSREQPLAYHSPFLSAPSGEQGTPGLAGMEAAQGCRDRGTAPPAAPSHVVALPTTLVAPSSTFCLRAKPLKFRKGFKIQQMEASWGGALAQWSLSEREVATRCKINKCHFFFFFLFSVEQVQAWLCWKQRAVPSDLSKKWKGIGFTSPDPQLPKAGKSWTFLKANFREITQKEAAVPIPAR